MGITYTLFYLLGTWSLSYGVKNLGFTQTDYLRLELAAVFFFAVFIVVGCLAADRYGRRPVLLLATLLTVVFSFFSSVGARGDADAGAGGEGAGD